MAEIHKCKCANCTCESNLPYRPGTTADQIIEDGFYRGFAIPQTYDELKQMGYQVKPSAIMARWNELEKEMIEFFEKEANDANMASSIGHLEFDIEMFKDTK